MVADDLGVVVVCGKRFFCGRGVFLNNYKKKQSQKELFSKK